MENDDKKKKLGKAINRAFAHERRSRSSLKNVLFIVGVLVVAFALRETGLIGDTHEVDSTVTGDVAALVTRLPQVHLLGDVDGKVVLFVFSDYLCSHCRRLALAIDEFLEANPDVRVAIVDVPGETGHSVSAARHALAAGLQEAWATYYRAMMYGAVPQDDADFVMLGEALGLDPERLRADAESQAVTVALGANRALASQLGIGDVPTIVVGDQMFVGFVDSFSLRDLVSRFAYQ